LGRQRIAPSVPDFLHRFPEIRLELDLSDRFGNIAQEGFDLAVRHARSIPDTYIARVLCESRSLLMASPEYFAAARTPEHPTDLAPARLPLVFNARRARSELVVRKGRLTQAGERVSVLSVGHSRPTKRGVARGIMADLGIGLLRTQCGCRRSAGAGGLAAGLDFGDRIYAIRPGGVRASRAVECAIEHLRQVFG